MFFSSFLAKLMSTPNDSIYATTTPEPTGPRAQYSYQSNNYPPQHPRQPASSGWGCTGFFLSGCAALFVIVFGGFLLFTLIIAVAAQMSVSFEELTNASSDTPLTEKYISGNRNASDLVAVLTIDGIITGAEDGFIAKQIRHITKDKNVKAVVLRVDSPGGTMSGSDYYYHLLKKMKEEREDLPIVVSMGSVAASGGYYVSMVGDEIFAERTTITGSIGVVVPLYKAVELSKKIGVDSTPITSGSLKTMGSIFKPMSEEEEAVWQRLVDDSFQRFKEVICEGREEFAKDPESLDKLATGQIYTATEAEANHLIDRIGFIDDAIAAAMNQAGLNEKNAKAVKYRSKLHLIEALLESRAPNNVFGTKTLQDLTTPRIHLICPHVLPIGE